MGVGTQDDDAAAKKTTKTNKVNSIDTRDETTQSKTLRKNPLSKNIKSKE